MSERAGCNHEWGTWIDCDKVRRTCLRCGVMERWRVLGPPLWGEWDPDGTEMERRIADERKTALVDSLEVLRRLHFPLPLSESGRSEGAVKTAYGIAARSARRFADNLADCVEVWNALIAWYDELPLPGEATRLIEMARAHRGAAVARRDCLLEEIEIDAQPLEARLDAIFGDESVWAPDP